MKRPLRQDERPFFSPRCSSVRGTRGDHLRLSRCRFGRCLGRRHGSVLLGPRKARLGRRRVRLAGAHADHELLSNRLCVLTERRELVVGGQEGVRKGMWRRILQNDPRGIPTGLGSSGSTVASRSSTAVGSGLSGARSRRCRDQVMATSLEKVARFAARGALRRLPVGLASARIWAACAWSVSAWDDRPCAEALPRLGME